MTAQQASAMTLHLQRTKEGSAPALKQRWLTYTISRRLRYRQRLRMLCSDNVTSTTTDRPVLGRHTYRCTCLPYSCSCPVQDAHQKLSSSGSSAGSDIVSGARVPKRSRQQSVPQSADDTAGATRVHSMHSILRRASFTQAEPGSRNQAAAQLRRRAHSFHGDPETQLVDTGVQTVPLRQSLDYVVQPASWRASAYAAVADAQQPRAATSSGPSAGQWHEAARPQAALDRQQPARASGSAPRSQSQSAGLLSARTSPGSPLRHARDSGSSQDESADGGAPVATTAPVAFGAADDAPAVTSHAIALSLHSSLAAELSTPTPSRKAYTPPMPAIPSSSESTSRASGAAVGFRQAPSNAGVALQAHPLASGTLGSVRPGPTPLPSIREVALPPIQLGAPTPLAQATSSVRSPSSAASIHAADGLDRRRQSVASRRLADSLDRRRRSLASGRLSAALDAHKASGTLTRHHSVQHRQSPAGGPSPRAAASRFSRSSMHHSVRVPSAIPSLHESPDASAAADSQAQSLQADSSAPPAAQDSIAARQLSGLSDLESRMPSIDIDSMSPQDAFCAIIDLMYGSEQRWLQAQRALDALVAASGSSQTELLQLYGAAAGRERARTALARLPEVLRRREAVLASLSETQGYNRQSRAPLQVCALLPGSPAMLSLFVKVAVLSHRVVPLSATQPACTTALAFALLLSQTAFICGLCFGQPLSTASLNFCFALQIFYRGPRGGSKIHCFRFIADFAIPTGDIVALAREWDLLHTWCWPAADSVILEERDDFDFDAYLVLQLPWPFPNRYTVMRVAGGDCLADDGSVVVLMETVDVDEVRASVWADTPGFFCFVLFWADCSRQGTI